ncbi:O-antigen ligase family protein [Paenibacillus sp. GCM10028914]|uniref:O-antigen ligase family protein n=1 Tax=Paenibacillus sp. GCM10028914 TaxID=3273416 RepID=UPI00362129E6
METIIAFIYVFHQAIGANLDLFYFMSLILIVVEISKQNKITLKAVAYIYLIVLYSLLQIVVTDEIHIQRLVINVAKVFLCLYLFLQVREMKLPRFSLNKIIKTTSVMNFILLLVSLVYKSDLLWRLDDNVNIYQKTRLSLLYFEPSEASFHAAILIILLMYQALRERDFKRNVWNLFFIATNFMIVLLSAGMGAMLGLMLASVLMYFYYIRERISTGKALMLIALVMISAVGIFVFITSKNSFFMRLTDILNGKDGSVVYRLNVSFTVMKQMLIESNFLGIGFGNLNTDATRSLYYSYGLVEVISNSFMYFIAEGGIPALILLVCLLISILYRVAPSERILKYSLFVFIMSYQIAGGYFTNPVNWIIYGLIANQIYMQEYTNHMSSSLVRSTNVNNLSQITRKWS